jgi:hypothetical protein
VTETKDNNGTKKLEDPAYAAGVIARVDSQLQDVIVEQARQSAEQSRQGRMLDKICVALSITPEKSEPPPKIREELDSLHEVDADTSQKIEAVTKDIAETKLVVRVGLIEGVPKLVKVGGALVAVLGVIAALAQQVWLALRGR